MAKQGDSVQVNCPKCGRKIRVPARLAGRQFRCPNQSCAFLLTIPSSREAPGPASTPKKKSSLARTLRKLLRGKLSLPTLAPQTPAFGKLTLGAVGGAVLRKSLLPIGAMLLALIVLFPPVQYGETKWTESPTGEWTHIVVRRHRGFVAIWAARPNKKIRWPTGLLLGGAVVGVFGASYYLARRLGPGGGKRPA